MLLDQLLEKKDVELYLKMRIEFLRGIKHNSIMNELPENRNNISKRFEGRIEELTKLLHIVTNGQIKNMSKSYFHKLEKMEKYNDLQIS